MKKAIQVFRIHTAPLVTALKASPAARKNPALMSALKESQKQMVQISEKVDAYSELQWSLAQQKEKLEALIFRERVIEFRRDYTSEAMELFVRTAKEIVQLEMKLGIRDIVPDEVNVKISKTVDGHITHRVEPIGRNKMMDAARTFSKLLEGPIYDAEYTEVTEESK